MLSDNKSLYKPIQCIVHIYTYIHVYILKAMFSPITSNYFENTLF